MSDSARAMDKQKLKIAAAELDELTRVVAYWQHRKQAKYAEVVGLVGICPVCDAEHYPRCGIKDL